jgi:nucleoside-diphosphate-sugar epimerase
MAKLAGKSQLMGRVMGSLYVDIRRAREELGWSPPYSVMEEIGQAVCTRTIEALTWEKSTTVVR